MARLKAAEQAYFYKLFVQNTGNVACFATHSQFDKFCEPIIGYRPSNKYGHCVTGYCFEDMLNNESVNTLIPFLEELLEYCIVERIMHR